MPVRPPRLHPRSTRLRHPPTQLGNRKQHNTDCYVGFSLKLAVLERGSECAALIARPGLSLCYAYV